jgi:predicted nucleic acid-binding protein
MEVACHPFIIGELACGNLKNRSVILSLLHSLPQAHSIENDELLHFIEMNKLMGRGIGLIDVHLLASARMAHIHLWTSDKKLLNISVSLQMAYIY